MAAGAAVGAAGTVGASTRPASAHIPLRREERRVIVIGSGFGGGVASLRLTRAGVPVTLLERGKRWVTGPDADTFPRVSSLDERALWHESMPEIFGRPLFETPHTGLLESVVGENMTVMNAAGLGGGSLAYQGMSLEPSAEVFASELPEELDREWMHRVHYRRVERMLKLRTAPDALVSSDNYKAARVFARKALAAGYDIEKIPMPIDWSYALRELRGEMKATYTNGDAALGVNNGGKHSVDVTYIRAAEATGLLEVRTLHNVTGIARTRSGAWEVRAQRTDTTGRVLEEVVYTTPTLIMGAGSTGTTRLLLKSAARGEITDLPEALGSNWGTNADRIYTWTSLFDDFGPVQGGPVVYGSKAWEDPATANTVIQASLPPLMAGGDPSKKSWGPTTTMLVGYGVSKDRGEFRYDAEKDDAILHWPKNGDRESAARIHARVKKIAGFASFLGDTTAMSPSTWHPLGGASMGTVCDLEGRVLGQKGLYVLDGALLPGTAAACNPSMTIAAVAERAMDKIVAHDVGRLV
ncbi:GMC oxidoreductase [Nocardioides daphniae]|uniref:Cholesterol oxidase n=1 Tax=Nocardioides daphniae TaxID=402297 RepID=A0A4P7UC84_9ACTN|nr:GMC oxidoreductase [Nocardioides daphniae]QCC76589.1 GMC family oxidoreductase [Nocardioides daphniae]GGD14344.1 cholesterol oxidase [Nocardioides daphniae]